MKNRNGREVGIRFDIYNYLNQKHLSTKIGGNDTDFIFQFDSLSDLEQAIENLIELREKFLEEM